MLRKHLTRTRLGLVLAVGIGVLVGAVFGQPVSGQAASGAVTKPVNKTQPVITGTAEVGLKVTTTRGTWTGPPKSFTFAWSRCDSDGACITIAGATGRSYTVTASDVGHTLIATVTAHNAAGATPAASPASAIVPPSGCPVGSGVIQITQLSPPADLVIAKASASGLSRSTKSLNLRVVIQACGGRPVQGADVLATAIPYNQFADASGLTGADGSTTLSGARRAGFPASPHQRLVAVFVRATAPNAPVSGGVSARRILAFRLGH